MNVTFNTYNTYNNYKKSAQRPQTFTGKGEAAERILNAAENTIINSVTGDSKSLTSISQKYDNFCNWVGKHICRPVFDNSLVDNFSDKIKDKDNAIKFFLIGGSAITSGVYMQRTLTNKKMDKDRKKTLAVNQFFTFLLSTAGALFLDKHLKSWWNEKKEQYFDLNVPNAEAIRNSMKEKNEKIKLRNEGLADVDKEPLYTLDSYLEKFGKKHFLDSKDYKNLMTKMKGFAALRSIIVFALVYRFLVPILVTKPANIVCDKNLAHKKAKDAQKAQQVELKPQNDVKTAA